MTGQPVLCARSQRDRPGLRYDARLEPLPAGRNGGDPSWQQPEKQREMAVIDDIGAVHVLEPSRTRLADK